jgi:hypothetical protein
MGHTILLADDSITIQKVIEHLLGRGFSCCQGQNNRWDPHANRISFFAASLCGKNGYGLRVRKSSQTQHSVLLLTGVPEPLTRNERGRRDAMGS